MNSGHATNLSERVIETHNLTKTYHLGNIEVKALRGVDVQVGQGEFVALMGPSGSGKSTLLHLLACLDTPTYGTYLLEGIDVSLLSNDERAFIRNQRIGIIFQNYNLLTRYTALENVMLPLTYQGVSNQIKERALVALDQVGLALRANHLPTELSGGERQRVAVARALITHPGILLADEPTGNLDSKTGLETMQLLRELNEKGLTILMVTHDVHISTFARRVIHMHDGRVTNGREKDVFF